MVNRIILLRDTLVRAASTIFVAKSRTIFYFLQQTFSTCNRLFDARQDCKTVSSFAWRSKIQACSSNGKLRRGNERADRSKKGMGRGVKEETVLQSGTRVEKRAASLCNLFCSNVGRRVEGFRCSYYRAFSALKTTSNSLCCQRVRVFVSQTRS